MSTNFIDKYYGLVSELNNTVLNSHKKSHLSRQLQGYEKDTQNIDLGELEAIANVIKEVQMTRDKIQNKRFLYDIAKDIESSFSPNSITKASAINSQIDQFEEQLRTFISQVGISKGQLNRAQSELLRIAERNMSPGEGNVSDVTDIEYTKEDVEKIDKITNNIFTDLDSARTSFGRLTSLLGNLRVGKLGKYKGDKSLYKGLVGYISNLTGLMYEAKLYEALNDKNIGKVLKSGGGTKRGVSSFTTKSDLQIRVPGINPQDMTKIKNLIGISVKSYKISRKKKGTTLHTGGATSI